MAAINLAQNTYAGIKYAEYLTPAILAPKGLVDRGLVTGIESVKNKVTLLGVNRVIEFQNPSAKFTASLGQVERNEKQIELVVYEVMDEIDAELLRTTWESEQQGRGSFEDYKLTPELYNFLLERIYVPRMSIANEQMYILGKAGVNAGEVATTSFTAAYNGLLPTMVADNDVRKTALPPSAKVAVTAVTSGAANAATITVDAVNDVIVGDELTLIGTDGDQESGGASIEGQTFVVLAKDGGVLTVDKEITGAGAATEGSAFFINQTNVLEVLTSVYLSIPQKVKKQITATGNGRTKIHCSSRIIDAYRVANGLVQGNGGRFTLDGYFEQDALIPYLDIDLVEMPYWSPNTLVAYNPGNVYLAYDLLSDEVFARVLYLGDITSDDIYRIKNRMKSQIDYKFAQEVFMYLPKV